MQFSFQLQTATALILSVCPTPRLRLRHEEEDSQYLFGTIYEVVGCLYQGSCITYYTIRILRLYRGWILDLGYETYFGVSREWSSLLTGKATKNILVDSFLIFILVL